ncbi:MAG: hypothetical protein AABY22_12365 [Nanoarchaeota archaeon]
MKKSNKNPDSENTALKYNPITLNKSFMLEFREGANLNDKNNELIFMIFNEGVELVGEESMLVDITIAFRDKSGVKQKKIRMDRSNAETITWKDYNITLSNPDFNNKTVIIKIEKT